MISCVSKLEILVTIYHDRYTVCIPEAEDFRIKAMKTVTAMLISW